MNSSISGIDQNNSNNENLDLNIKNKEGQKLTSLFQRTDFKSLKLSSYEIFERDFNENSDSNESPKFKRITSNTIDLNKNVNNENIDDNGLSMEDQLDKIRKFLPQILEIKATTNFRRVSSDYILANYSSGMVLQKQNDYCKSIKSGLFIPKNNQKNIIFDGDSEILKLLVEEFEHLKEGRVIPKINANFTLEVSIDEQRDAHLTAKKYLERNLERIKAIVDFVSPEKLSAIPNVADVQITSYLCSDVFSWNNTKGIQNDIQTDAKNSNTTSLYLIASQYNAAEYPGRGIAAPGQAVSVYKCDNTQGPIAQLQFPDDQVELINNSANLGYNALCNVLNQDTKACVEYGYLTPSQEKADAVIDQFAQNGHLLEFPCIGNIPKGEGNTEIVYEMLVAAPAFGTYNIGNHFAPASIKGVGNEVQRATKEQTNQLQFIAALHGFRALFYHAIVLASRDSKKQVICKPSAIGMGVFKNSYTNIAKAYYTAAKEYEKRLKEHNVLVEFQVYMGMGDARKLVSMLEISEKKKCLLM